jgi:hypothetical protein
MRYLKELGHEVHHANYQRSAQHEVKGTLIAPEVVGDIAIPHVRWCLNKPGLLGGPKSYPAGTKVFHFCPELEDAARAASPDFTSTEFTLGTIDIPKFDKITDGKIYSVWYQGKYRGEFATHEPHKPHFIQMTRHWPPTKQEYWNLLAHTKVFYSYDDFSAVNLEAFLMGCTVFVNDGTWRRYEMPENADRLILDHDRNRDTVEKFVDMLTK